jgi:hypothetical protein
MSRRGLGAGLALADGRAAIVGRWMGCEARRVVLGVAVLVVVLLVAMGQVGVAFAGSPGAGSGSGRAWSPRVLRGIPYIPRHPHRRPGALLAQPFGVHNQSGPACEKEGPNGECLQRFEAALYYDGGEVLNEPKLYLIFWGSNFTKTDEGNKWHGALVNTLRGMTTEYNFNTTYQRILHQYWDEQTEPHQISETVTVGGEYIQEGAPAQQGVNKSIVEEDVNYAITVNHWPRERNSLFLLIQAPGTVYEQKFAEGKGTGCGFHEVDRWGDVYGFVPDLSNKYFELGCAGGTTVKRAMTETATHEYAEAVTDPHPTTAPAWTNLGGWEIADICDEKPELVNEPLSIWVSALWGNHEGECVIHDPPEPGPPPPAVTTEAATNIQETQATLHGVLNPNGPHTHYYFQYGETTSYGFTTPEGDAGSGTSNVSESATISKLQPGTTYHYRIVASSWAGTSHSVDQTLTTLYENTPSSWVVRDPRSGGQWVYYRGSNGDLMKLEYSSGSGWSEPYYFGPMEAGTRATAVLDPNTHDQWVYWAEPNNTLATATYVSGRGWAVAGLGYAMAPGSSPVVVAASATGLSSPAQWVYYRGSNGHMMRLEYNSNWKEPYDLGPMEAGTSATAVRDPQTNNQWVYWAAPNDTLATAADVSGHWSLANLGFVLAPGASPTAVVEVRTGGPNPNQWVYYRDPNGHLIKLAYNATSGWEPYDFGPMEAGTSATAVRDPRTNNQWVYWAAPNDTLATAADVSGHWSLANLGFVLAPGASPAGAAETGTGNNNPPQWVYYGNSNGDVMNAAYTEAKGWSGGDVGGPIPAVTGTGAVVVRDPAGPNQWIYYRGSNGDLMKLEFTAAFGWSEPYDFGPMQAGTKATVTRDPQTGDQWVYWEQPGNTLAQAAYVTGRGWALAGLGFAMAPGASPAAVAETGTGNNNPAQWVYYRGTNGDLMKLEYNSVSGWSKPYDFGPMQASTTATATRDPKTGNQWVYWVAANGEVVTAGYVAGRGWALGNVGGSAATGTSPAAVVETGTESSNPKSWIYYSANSGYILSLTGSINQGWRPTEL